MDCVIQHLTEVVNLKNDDRILTVKEFLKEDEHCEVFRGIFTVDSFLNLNLLLFIKLKFYLYKIIKLESSSIVPQ